MRIFERSIICWRCDPFCQGGTCRGRRRSLFLRGRTEWAGGYFFDISFGVVGEAEVELFLLPFEDGGEAIIIVVVAFDIDGGDHVIVEFILYSSNKILAPPWFWTTTWPFLLSMAYNYLKLININHHFIIQLTTQFSHITPPPPPTYSTPRKTHSSRCPKTTTSLAPPTIYPTPRASNLSTCTPTPLSSNSPLSRSPRPSPLPSTSPLTTPFCWSDWLWVHLWTRTLLSNFFPLISPCTLPRQSRQWTNCKGWFWRAGRWGVRVWLRGRRTLTRLF